MATQIAFLRPAMGLFLVTCSVATFQGIPYDVVKGGDVELNQAGTSYVSVARFSASYSVVCYADFGQGGSCICKALNVSGVAVGLGAEVVVSENATQYLSVARLSDTTGVVCYVDQGESGHVTCHALSLSEQVVSSGAPLVVDAAADQVTYLSVDGSSATASTLAVVCYSDTASQPFGQGRCATLSSSGMVLTKGADILVNSAFTSYISVARLSETACLVCYASGASGLSGICTGLTLTDANLTVFDHLEITENITSHVSVSRLSEDAAIVCYSDESDENYGKCSVLNYGGGALSQGTGFIVNGDDSYHISVAGFSETEAVVCYASGNSSNIGTCTAVSLSGTEPAVGTSSLVNYAKTNFLSVARSSDTSGVVCYTDNGFASVCSALEIGLVTSTTSTQTSTSTRTGTETSSMTATATSASLTATSLTATSFTATNTTGTTLSSQTETSSSTEFSMTATSGTTTPHTTTGTSFTDTSVTTLIPESDGAFRLPTEMVTPSLLVAVAVELLGVIH